jgi:hypothetical protein
MELYADGSSGFMALIPCGMVFLLQKIPRVYYKH